MRINTLAGDFDPDYGDPEIVLALAQRRVKEGDEVDAETLDFLEEVGLLDALSVTRSAPPCIGCDEQRHPGHSPQSVHAGKNRGSTTGAGTKGDPIKTTNVNVAAQALGEGKYVELSSERQVSTMLDDLAARANDAKAKGKKAPDFNLCGVSVGGSNVFCAENKGVPRVRMPQLKGVPEPGSKADSMPKNDKGEVDIMPAFVDHLAGRGIGVSDDRVPAEMLKASQNELNGGKVGGMVGAMQAGTMTPGSIVTTRDDYVVDGHHRYAARVGVGFSGGDTSIDVVVIDADIIPVLAMANNFTTSMGIPHAGVSAPVPPDSPGVPAQRSLQVQRSNKTRNYAPWQTRGGVEMDVSDRAGRNVAEIRSFTIDDLEMRDEGKLISFEGVASVVDVPYSVRDQFGEYTETISPGAFKRTIGIDSDVRLLKNHDPSAVFARTKSGTLSLRADPHLRALAPSLDPANPAVQMLRSELKRGDIDQMSIGFRAKEQEWSEDYSERTITEIALQEVSIVAFPASPTTSASVRSITEQVLALDEDVDPDELRRAIAILQGRLPVAADALTPDAIRKELLRLKI